MKIKKQLILSCFFVASTQMLSSAVEPALALAGLEQEHNGADSSQSTKDHDQTIDTGPVDKNLQAFAKIPLVVHLRGN